MIDCRCCFQSANMISCRCLLHNEPQPQKGVQTKKASTNQELQPLVTFLKYKNTRLVHQKYKKNILKNIKYIANYKKSAANQELQAILLSAKCFLIARQLPSANINNEPNFPNNIQVERKTKVIILVIHVFRHIVVAQTCMGLKLHFQIKRQNKSLAIPSKDKGRLAMDGVRGRYGLEIPFPNKKANQKLQGIKS